MEKDKKDNESENNKDEKKEINYFLYEDQPEKLFPLAQEQFNKNKFEEGLEILEQSIIIAIKKFGGENKIELAQFYNKYADGLIQKITTLNVDILNFHEEEVIQEVKDANDEQSSKNKIEEKEKEKEKDKDKEENKEKEKEEKKEENKDEEKKKDEEGNNNQEKKVGKDNNNEAVEDEQIIYENLNAANILLKNYLKEYDEKDPKTLDKSIIKYYLQLCDNYSLFASLEKINSDFKKANEYFKLSIEICKKYDEKFSRTLAGLYFEQSQILDFDPKNCLLSLYKSKIIMEQHLQMEIDKNNLKIKLDIDEKDLELETLSFDDKRIFKNKDLIMQNKELIDAASLNCNIEEFISIIKDINIKIEDVILELKEYDLFLKTKEQMKKDGEKQNSFNTNIDMSKVIDLSKTTLIKKKRKEPFYNNDDDKKEEELNQKKSKLE